MNALSISLSVYLGPHGAMLLIPLLWHPMGHIFSETGVQQGDPLGPLLFALVLQNIYIINAIDADDDCIHILYQAWYLDDGTLAGMKFAILRALSLLDSIGPFLGIFINMCPNVHCFVKVTPVSVLHLYIYLTLTYLELL